jgi:DNA-binding response OmpR family regulator
MPRKRVLLVDDEEELLKAMKIRLASWGYDVITATNGKEAIRLVKKEVPDAVILDIMMPEMDGIETLKRIRRVNKKIPVLMFTAYSNGERMKLSNEFGISGFIPKGADATDASEAIRIILKGAKK